MGRAEIAEKVFEVISEYTGVEVEDLTEDTPLSEIGIKEYELEDLLGDISEQLETEYDDNMLLDGLETIEELIDIFEE